MRLDRLKVVKAMQRRSDETTVVKQPTSFCGRCRSFHVRRYARSFDLLSSPCAKRHPCSCAVLGLERRFQAFAVTCGAPTVPASCPVHQLMNRAPPLELV